MKNLFLFLFILFCFILKPSSSSAQIDTRFWFAAPDISRRAAGSSLDRPILMRFAAFDQPATVVISMPATPSFTPIVVNLLAFGAQSVDLTTFINLIETPRMTTITGVVATDEVDANRNYSAIFNSGLLVESTARITAYYEPNAQNNPDIFSLKGKNGLGTDFYVPMQTEWNSGGYSPNGHSGFVIVATEDNTTVTVTTTRATRSFGTGASGTTSPAGLKPSFILNRGQTYTVAAQQPSAGNAPAGSHVVSNKPIAVTVYHDLINAAIGAGGCADLAGDQLVPVNIIGSEYIVMRGNLGVGSTAQPEKVYILATQPSTTFTVSRNGTPIAGTPTLAAGQQYVFDMDFGTHPKAYIKSNKPIYVLHMSGYGCETGAAILPPIECTGSRLVQFNRSTNENFSLTLLVKEGGQGDFTLDGTPIPVSNFSPVLGSPDIDPANGTPDWYSARIDYNTATVAVGGHSIENTTTLFHAGITNGGATSGCRYGYFSSFNSLNLGPDIGIFYGSNVVLDAQTYGAVSYTWNTTPVQTTPQITVNVRRTRDYIVAVDLGRCIVYDTICVGTVEYVWIGDTDDDYGKFSNWSAPCGEDGIPDCSRDIVVPALVNGIPPVNFPRIYDNETQACRNVIVENGASLTISPLGRLNVCGDMVHSGTLNMPTGSLLEFRGLQPQTYTKNASGTGEFARLQINNLTPLPDIPRLKVSDAGTQNMIVSPTGTLTFIRGVIRTEGLKEVVVRNPLPSAISGYSLANSTNDRFVGGRLRRAINPTGTYDLPVGLAVENIGAAVAEPTKRASIVNTVVGDWVADASFCALNPFPSNRVINLTDNRSAVADAPLYKHIAFPASVAILGNAPRTVEAWVRISSNPSNGAIFYVGRDATKELFALRKIGTGNGYRIDLGGGITKDFNLAGTVGAWQHFAMTYNGISEVKVYLNGNEVESLNITDLNTTGNFYVGRYRNSTNQNWYLAGRYDNIRIWNVARSAGEIFANFCVRYECTIPPELIGNYDMEDGFGFADTKTRNCSIDPLQYERARVEFQTPMTTANNLLAFFNQYPGATPISPNEYRCQATFGTCEVLNHGFWTLSAFNNITQVAGDGRYRMTLYNNAYTNGGACASPEATIMKRNVNTDPWTIPPFPTLCADNSLGSTSMEWMSGFSDFAVPQTFDPVILPVDLLLLTAKPLINTILVEWKTTNEINNEGFEVMRSIDGKDFTNVGWVAQNNTGVYSFEDTEVNTNQIYYYHLNQIDNNGDKKISPIVDAKIDGSLSGGVKVYPNPTSNEFIIDLGETYTANTIYQVEIYNSIGMLLHNKTISNSSKINMSLEGFAKGMYLVKITTPSRTKIVKLQKE
ncbi:LamG-like jellyroll fold domain-containing protein [Bernardetia sp. OM2101]|uniref:LamG-like jellyroll fold domain-containing protein n=1 Tax=Bernardetia sp. OM2101 TaxID=3344876 RepID=UPI0035D12C58